MGKEYDFFSIKEGDTIINLGAHQGQATILFSKKVGKKGLVVSLEPAMENYKILVERIVKKNLENVIPLPMAISNKISRMKLYTGPTEAGYSLVFNRKKGYVTVPTITWDNLLEMLGITKVYLAKVDIEGSEVAFLEGMTKYLPEKMIIEEHIRYGTNLDKLKAMLEIRGYKWERKGIYLYCEKKECKTVLVVGMARTGTSLIAGILYHLGVDICTKKETKRKDEFNSQGYFERNGMGRIIERLYRQRWQDDIPTEEEKKASFKENEKKLLDTLEVLGVRRKGLWSFKDAKTAFLLEQLHPYLRNIHLIISQRDLVAVTKSFSRRNKMDPEHTEALYKEAYSLIKKFIAKHDVPYVYLEYAKILKNPERNVELIIKFLGLNPTEEQKNAATESVNKKLCHF